MRITVTGKVVGRVRLSRNHGLQFSLVPTRTRKPTWLPVLDVGEWRGIGQRPEEPSEFNSAAEERAWKRAAAAYDRALYSDPIYKQTAIDILKRQRHEPQPVEDLPDFWFYSDKVLKVCSDEPLSRHSQCCLIRHFLSNTPRRRVSADPKSVAAIIESLVDQRGLGLT